MYRWLEHESELELLVEDENPRAVLTEALVALGDLLTEERGGDPVTHEVRVSASDLPTLLAEWLNELVYLAEADGFVPERVVRMELGETSLEATVAGQRSVPRNVVKAVTYNRLEIEETDGAWWARVVMDV
jgi:SHS2 domain-containing protein